jgi:hypothetical protein
MGLHADIGHEDRRARRGIDDQHVARRYEHNDRVRVKCVWQPSCRLFRCI